MADKEAEIIQFLPMENTYITKDSCNLKQYTIRCDKGHTMKTYEPFAMQVFDGAGKTTSYVYCPFCFGEWMTQQWPMRAVEEEDGA